MHIPSSYRYYKLPDLAAICNVRQKEAKKMLSPIPELVPSDWLIMTLEMNQSIPMKNEKAKSELIVMPILVEMWAKNQNFKPLSGLSLNVDSAKGLKGRCDFLVSANPDVMDLDLPIVCVFEAKDDNIDNWYGQCGAEMYAARLFNQQKNNDIDTIHGAITNGFTWQFLKLEGQILYIDSQRYGLANLPQLLGAIQKVYNFYK
jgi:hypothetical protein